MKYLILILSLYLVGCNEKVSQTEVVLTKFIFNKLPLPNETKINDRVLKRNFELELSETHAIKRFDFEKLKKGVFDTTFQYYPIKIKAGELSLNNTKFQIGLIDENRNGSFNELGIDKLIFLPKNTDSIYYYPLIYSSVLTLKEDVLCKINGSIYRVKVKNNAILLRIDSLNTNKVDCTFNSIVPDIIVQKTNGEAINLRMLKEPNKNLIIELWFNGCRGCIKTIPKLKDLDVEENTVISFNVTDNLDVIRDFGIKHQIPWLMVKGIKDDLVDLGNLGNYPSAIVYDKNGELLDLSKTYDLKREE